MELEVINVIYNGINYYTMFEIEESTKNVFADSKIFSYSSQHKLLVW